MRSCGIALRGCIYKSRHRRTLSSNLSRLSPNFFCLLRVKMPNPKPERQAILQKVSEKQEFDSGESCLGKIDNIVEGFEENVLCVLREFEKDMKK